MKYGKEFEVKKHGERVWIKKYFSNPLMELFSIRPARKRRGNDDPSIEVVVSKGLNKSKKQENRQ